MKISDCLNDNKNCLVLFESESTSFFELLEALQPLKESHFYWTGKWNRHHFTELLCALEFKTPVLCGETHKWKNELLSGEILFKSSGSEGRPKGVIHTLASFTPSLYNLRLSSTLAFLRPEHAAGFDLIIYCLSEGINFGFCDLKNYQRFPIVKQSFGPPQVLTHLMNFSSGIDFLMNLSTFYISGESILEMTVKKLKELQLNVKLENYYGTTETMFIKTNTHPHRPWLMQVIDQRFKMNLDKLEFKSNAPVSFIQENNRFEGINEWVVLDQIHRDEGWINLKNARRYVTKIWGESVNILEIEEALLQNNCIQDVFIELKTFQQIPIELTLRIWCHKDINQNEIYEAHPILQRFKKIVKVVFEDEDNLSEIKRKRLKHES